MNNKACEIKAGDTLCIEYGAPDNFVNFKVRAVFSTDSKTMVLTDSNVGSETFVLDPETKVIVVPNV